MPGRICTLLSALVIATLCFGNAGASDVIGELDALRAQGNLPAGTIVKADNRPELYLIVPGGNAAHIPTVQIISCLGMQDRRPLVIAREKLKSLPKTPLLLKNPAGDIYKISGDRKRHITSPAAFKRHGYDPVAVLSVSGAQLNCIRDGAPIN